MPDVDGGRSDHSEGTYGDPPPDDSDGLRSGVGFLDAVAIEVGLIVGAGLFALTGVATGLAGPAVPLSYVLSFTVVVLGLVPTAALATAFPTVAGNYRYPRDLVSPHLAFLSAWGLTVSMFGGGLPLYALSFGQYVETLVGVAPRATAVLTLTFFFLVNLLGIRPAAKVQILLFLSLVASLLSFVVVGFPSVQAANFAAPFRAGPAGIVTGAAILYFVCLGANFVVDLGGEVRDAAVTIPKSFLVSVPLAMVLYALTAFVAVGSVGPETLAGQTLDVPAEAILPPALATFFVVGGALFATATTLNAVFMIAPKYLLVLADDGIFPDRLGAVNDRFGTPHWGLTLVYVVTVLSVLSPLPFEDLGSLLGFGGIFLIVPVMVAAIRFVRRRPEDYAALPFPVPRNALVGLAATGVVANAVLFALLGANSTWVLSVWAGGMVVGEAYYLVRRTYLRRRGRRFGTTDEIDADGGATVTDPGPGTATAVDPEAATPTDPEAATPTDPEAGSPTDPEAATPTDPEAGFPTDPEATTSTDPEAGSAADPDDE